jgi:hypothetical protein
VIVDDVLDEDAGVVYGRVIRGIRERERLREVAPPRAAAAAQDERLGAGPLTLDEGGRRRPSGAKRRDGARQLALRLGRDRQPHVTGAKRTHEGMVSCD